VVRARPDARHAGRAKARTRARSDASAGICRDIGTERDVDGRKAAARCEAPRKARHEAIGQTKRRREEVMARAGRSRSTYNGMLAVYAGSFDPVTLGHLDLIERASHLFQNVIVGIGVHPTKSPLFTADERESMLERVTGRLRNVTIERFDGLLIDFCHNKGARVVVRGLRAATDFEYELQIAHANADLRPEIDTVFLPTRTKHGFVSASLVREIASHGGDVSRYAPASVCAALAKKFGTK
jgi:pantetheine-phosphate adenylyltransferase